MTRIDRLRCVAFVGAALSLTCAAAQGASTNIGFVVASATADWLCGPKKNQTDDHGSCRNAKFNECSECETLVVENKSATRIRLSENVEGSAFSLSNVSQIIIGCPPPTSLVAKGGCSALGPGERCFERVQFCPDRSGLNEGKIAVAVKDSEGIHTSTFALVGTGLYNRQQEAAESVMRGHMSKLMKIPGVAKVLLAGSSNQITIDLEIGDSPSDQELRKIRQMAPRRIGGYEIRVVPQQLHDRAL